MLRSRIRILPLKNSGQNNRQAGVLPCPNKRLAPANRARPELQSYRLPACTLNRLARREAAGKVTGLYRIFHRRTTLPAIRCRAGTMLNVVLLLPATSSNLHKRRDTPAREPSFALPPLRTNVRWPRPGSSGISTRHILLSLPRTCRRNGTMVKQVCVSAIGKQKPLAADSAILRQCQARLMWLSRMPPGKTPG